MLGINALINIGASSNLYLDHHYVTHMDSNKCRFSYFDMAALKASEPAAGPNTGVPCSSMPVTSVREQSMVRRMKLHVWGTSTSTCEKDVRRHVGTLSICRH